MVLVKLDDLDLVRAVLAQMLAAGHNQQPPTHEDVDKAFWMLDAAHKGDAPSAKLEVGDA